MTRYAILTLSVMTFLSCSSGPRYESRADFKAYFDKAGVQGTFVLNDVNKKHYYVYNADRAKTGFLPASTYKIFNSLVALETGAVKDEETVIKWDGVDRGWEKWNQDHNLRSAIKYSAVWFYQELARRVGEKRMRAYVNEAAYGNKNIDGGIDKFWLEGELQVTALEQIDFLVRLYKNDLPFSPRSLDIVKDILIYEKKDDYTIRAKSGWARLPTHQIGWWVGYVESNSNVYFFAMNIDIIANEDAKARFAITKEIFHHLGLIEEEVNDTSRSE